MYFNRGYIDFFQGLAEHNEKAWFKENRKWYELAVREPFKRFVELLIPGVRKIDEEIFMEAKDAIFKINRDLRFSHNKPRYTTHMAAGFSRGGKKSQFAGYYFQIGPKHIVIGGGLPFLEKEMLKKIRIEIGFKMEDFNQIIRDQAFQKYYGFIHGESDRFIPKSFSDIYEESPLIANKQFYYGSIYNTEEWIMNDDLPQFILDHFKAGTPFNQFLIRAASNYNGHTVKPKSVITREIHSH